MPPPIPRQPAPQPQAVVRPQPRSTPTARGQKPEEPRAAKPQALPPMPTPEQLGVAVPKPADWTELRIRLDRLGASQFQLMAQADGWHFSCLLPGGRKLEGRGQTDADAVLQVLAQIKN